MKKTEYEEWLLNCLKEFEEQKKEINDLMINGLFIYVRKGVPPLSNANSLMKCYDIIYKYTEMDIGDEILKFHNEIIKQSVIECYEKVQNLNGLEFIESFIIYTERLNYMILQMSRIFHYISTNYLQSLEDKGSRRIYKQDDVSEFSMDIYKEYFFDKLEKKLFKIMNDIIIRNENNNNIEYSKKFEAIMKIINYLDLVKPKISKSTNYSAIWVETDKYKKESSLKYQNRWLNFFKEETRNIYINDFENKIEKAIKDESIKENIKKEINKLNEELENQIKIDNFFEIDINLILYERIIKKYIEPIIDIKEMLENKKIEEF